MADAKETRKSKKATDNSDKEDPAGKAAKVNPEEEWAHGLQTQFGEIYPDIE